VCSVSARAIQFVFFVFAFDNIRSFGVAPRRIRWIGVFQLFVIFGFVIACEHLLDQGSYLLRQPPSKESKKQCKVQLVYRSTTTTDLIGNLWLQFVTVSQPDGPFLLGRAQRIANLRELPLVFKGVRMTGGTTLLAAVRRKVYQVRIDQFVIKFTFTII
jgi:hypothetical protein